MIGLKQNSNGKTGVVYVNSVGKNQHGHVVLDYTRWVMVNKKDQSKPAPIDLNWVRMRSMFAAVQIAGWMFRSNGRWLLMCRDRSSDEKLRLTQEFIAKMLGTRRSRVSEAAIILQEQGLIRYSRGHITILNRKGLEEFTCECYAVVKAEFERLLGK